MAVSVTTVRLTDVVRRKLGTDPPMAGILVGMFDSAGGVVVVDLVGVGISEPKDPKYAGKTQLNFYEGLQDILPQGLLIVGAYAEFQETVLTILQASKVRTMLSTGARPKGAPAVTLSTGPMPPPPPAHGPNGNAQQHLQHCTELSTMGSLVVTLVAQPSGTVLSEAPLESDVQEAETLSWLVASHQILRAHANFTLRTYTSRDLSGAKTAKKEEGDNAARTQHEILRAFEEIQEQLSLVDVVYLATPGAGGAPALLAPGTPGTVQQLSGSLGQPVDIVPLLRSTSSAAAWPMMNDSAPATGTASSGPPASAPVLQYQPLHANTEVECSSVDLSLDVLAYVPHGAPLATLGTSVLWPALLRQLHAAKGELLRRQRLVPVRAYHFLPAGRAHHLTLLYPTLDPDPQTNEAQLAGVRSKLHDVLLLPADRPAFRTAHALDFGAVTAQRASGGTGVDGELSTSGALRLRDVHATLPQPASGGTVSLVSGHYEYYHYLQDRTNDAGWGCAYRSLQTIVSWFRANKYTSHPVPTHRQIQEALVRVGDKPQSFVGSSNWIGAIELSYVLDELLGVTSKIITVNRGSDIPSYVRQLAAHFQAQGTPVMIGGGVLAYTLLGVRFDERTGEAAFLILDPHYTGGEDLRKVHQGGWVGWKKMGDSAAAGGPLFVQDAFYNFLCPQRPRGV